MMHIELVPDAVPVRRLKPRVIPIHWEARVKAQLDHMVEKGVAEKAVGPPYDGVPKKSSDEPRMVVDLMGLNRYVQRPVHLGGVPRDLVA